MRLLRGWQCIVFIGAFVYLGAGVASAGDASPGGIGGDFTHEPPLVVANAQWLFGSQMGAVEAAKRANPEAVAARATSTTAFRRLDAGAAEKLANESFASVIDKPNGGPPKLPIGERIGRFASPSAAQLDLGPHSKQHALVISSEPMAVQTSPGHWKPLDLGLRRSGSGFVAATPLVPARLPERLSEGATLPSAGLTITPVDASGRPLGGSAGTIDGSSVFMANTLPDTDSILKLSTMGLSVDTMLRSQDSPERLSFRLASPGGTRLSVAADGAVRVVSQDRTVAQIPVPSAVDAAGTFVPVGVHATGDVLTLTVKRAPGEYRYPVEVDPEFNTTTESKVEESDWKANPLGVFPVKYEFPNRMSISTSSYSSGQYGAVGYRTKGDSKIYEINATTESGSRFTNGTQTFLDGNTGENYIQLLEPKGTEKRAVVAKEAVAITEFPTHTKLCASLGCSVEGGEEGNQANFYELALTSGNVYFYFAIESATVSISQPKETHSTVAYNTSSAELEVTPGIKTPNVLHNRGWLGPKSGAFEFESKDAGLGVSATGVEVKNESGEWKPVLKLAHNYLTSSACAGVQCAAAEKEVVTYEMVNTVGIKNGESNFIRVSANDPMAKTSSLEHGEGETTLKVDAAVPYGIEFSGVAINGKGEAEIDESLTNHVKISASDGTSPTPSSGVKSISVYVDGSEIGASNGSCSPGPCQAKGEWLLNGGALGAGEHKLTIVVTDNAGNQAERTIPLFVYHASATQLGPGTANVESGNFALSATDVSMSGGLGSLTVTRHYQSRNPTAGATGPLGPQWSIGLAAAANVLEVMPDGTVLFQGEDAGVVFERQSDGKFESPEGDGNVTLEAVEQGGSITAYLVKNAALGTTTRYTRPAGATVWLPTVSEGPNSTTTTTDEYTTVEPERGKKIVRPILEVAPHGSATCAYKKLEKGCRALEFNYAESTTATGEGQSEWGDYKGDLTRVYFIAWDPAAKEMKTTTVAQYSYDTKGRLRAVWDPRISPALKTVYGYDAEGHVTALTQPGTETWAFTYGTAAGDATPGRVLKATQAPATADLWNGASVSNTEAPAISGTPIVGNRLTVSDGAWSGLPVVYGYQWKDCNSVGAECVPIAGANNPNYTATTGDLGHRLVVQVTATNGGGSVAANSAASSAIANTVGTYSQAVDTGSALNAVSCVPGSTKCVVVDSKGNARYATNVSTTAAATWTTWNGPGASPSEAVSCPSASLCLLAAGSNENGGGNLYSATSLGGGWTTQFSDSFGVLALSCPSTGFCFAADKTAEEHWSTAPTTSWKGNTLIPFQVGNDLKAVSCLSSSFCAVASSDGDVYVAVTIAQLESSEWTKTTVDSTKALDGIACTATTSCVAVNGSGKVFNLAVGSGGAVTSTSQTIDSGHSLTAISCTSSATCVTVDDHGNVFMSYNAGATWNEPYKIGDDLTSVSCASPALCVAADTVGTVDVFDTAPVSQTIDSGNGLNAISCTEENKAPYCVTSDSKGNAFYATNVSAGEAAKWNAWTGLSGISPSEAITCPSASLCLMASGSRSGNGGNLYYATSLGGAWTLATSPVYGVDAISCASTTFCVAGQDNLGYFRYSTSPGSTSWTLEQQGSSAQKGVSCLSSSFCAMVDGAGTVRVATSTAQIESSTWTETKVDGGPLNGIVCLTTSACVAVDNSGQAIHLTIQNGKAFAQLHDIDGTTSMTAIACTTNTTCVAGDSKGNSFVSTDGGESWTQQDRLGAGLTGISCLSSSFCLAADSGGNVDKLSGRSIYEGESRGPQPGTTIEYKVPASGSGAPYALSSGEAARWGQTDVPVTATAVFPPDEQQGWPATDYNRATLYYMDSHARETNIARPGGGISTTEYNSSNDPVRTLSAVNRATALKAGFLKSVETAKLLDEESVYSQGELIETLGPQHTVKIVSGNEKVPSGSEALARKRTKFYYDEGAPESEIYELVTKKTEGALVSGGEEFDVRTTTNSYSGQNNLGWKLRAPTSTTVDPAGLKLTHVTLYDEITGAVVETRGPASAGAGDPHDVVNVYYTAAANSSYPACGQHVEWTGLVCESLPGKQPETPGLPALPVTSTQYNIWDQAETVTETFGSTTRTRKTTFDPAGRGLKAEVTSTNGVAVPVVTDTYDEKTGALIKQSEVVEGKEKTIQTKYDTRGRVQSYTDADGGQTTFDYDGDNRLTGMSEWTPEVGFLGKETYTYDPVTGQLTELNDTSAGKFTASYDASGEMVSETYPNKITATLAHNAAGETTGIEYQKTAYCATSCPEKWSSDEIVPSIHGEAVKESGTLGEEPKLAYDAAGRLTEVQEIPTGQGCTTRIYAYDQESNRTSLTTRAPGAEGKCATEGGAIESHTYDPANRLIDSGVAYETFGNITKVPASDAGGAGMEITSTYYVDGQLATQEQNGKATSYYLDPAGRTRETRAPGVSVMHYATPGQAVAWTIEPESKWTRNIAGIDGALVATEQGTSVGSGTTLMLHDLHGDTVGTAAREETQTKLQTTYKSTEFGVPVNGTPPKFSWLGALGISTESPSGLVVQQGSTYVPQVGRSLQASVVLPKPTNATPQYEMTLASWAIEDGNAFAKQFTEAAEAERKAAEENLQISESGETSGPEEEEEEEGATISTVGHACKAYWEMGSETEVVWVTGHLECERRVAKVAMNTCMWWRAEREIVGHACTGTAILSGIKVHEQAVRLSGCNKQDQYTGYETVHRWNRKNRKGVWYNFKVPTAPGYYPWGECVGTEVEADAAQIVQELLLKFL